MRPRAAGGLVVATETGVVLLDEHDAPSHLCEILDEPGIRMNDGGCDPQGRFWCGSMAYDVQPRSRARCIASRRDGSFDPALDGVTISNGLGWSPDGATAFYVDSMAHGIDCFAFDGASGTLSRRRRFAEVEASLGLPDGLAVDAEGGVWVALWDGGAVHRYAPDGTLDAIVPLPCGRVTALRLRRRRPRRALHHDVAPGACPTGWTRPPARSSAARPACAARPLRRSRGSRFSVQITPA